LRVDIQKALEVIIEKQARNIDLKNLRFVNGVA
jgi:hypothetical protein